MNCKICGKKFLQSSIRYHCDVCLLELKRKVAQLKERGSKDIKDLESIIKDSQPLIQIFTEEDINIDYMYQLLIDTFDEMLNNVE